MFGNGPVHNANPAPLRTVVAASPPPVTAAVIMRVFFGSATVCRRAAQQHDAPRARRAWTQLVDPQKWNAAVQQGMKKLRRSPMHAHLRASTTRKSVPIAELHDIPLHAFRRLPCRHCGAKQALGSNRLLRRFAFRNDTKARRWASLCSAHATLISEKRARIAGADRGRWFRRHPSGSGSTVRRLSATRRARGNRSFPR